MPDNLKKPTIVLDFTVYDDPEGHLIRGVRYILSHPGTDFRPATGYEVKLHQAYVEALAAYMEAERQLEYMRRLREAP